MEKLKKIYRDREDELLDYSTYIDLSTGKLSSNGLQKLFFDTLKSMGLEGKVNLQKIEDSGLVQNITLNSDGNGTTPTPCP